MKYCNFRNELSNVLVQFRFYVNLTLQSPIVRVQCLHLSTSVSRIRPLSPIRLEQQQILRFKLLISVLDSTGAIWSNLYYSSHVTQPHLRLPSCPEARTALFIGILSQFYQIFPNFIFLVYLLFASSKTSKLSLLGISTLLSRGEYF